MKIAVLIKQVPDTDKLEIDKETGTLHRGNAGTIVNPFDLHALEEALKIKEYLESTKKAHITIISMGPPRAELAIKECLQYGADQGFLLSDRHFGGSDTLATAKTLAAAIERLGPFDLILCGKQAIDGDTGQVGPAISALLEIPYITEADNIQIKEPDRKRLLVKRFTQEGHDIIKGEMPILITVSKDINIPRLASIKNIRKAQSLPFAILDADQLGLDTENSTGLKGSPTRVVKIKSPDTNRQNQVITGSSWECARAFSDYLINKGFVKK